MKAFLSVRVQRGHWTRTSAVSQRTVSGWHSDARAETDQGDSRFVRSAGSASCTGGLRTLGFFDGLAGADLSSKISMSELPSSSRCSRLTRGAGDDEEEAWALPLLPERLAPVRVEDANPLGKVAPRSSSLCRTRSRLPCAASAWHCRSRRAVLYGLSSQSALVAHTAPRAHTTVQLTEQPSSWRQACRARGSGSDGRRTPLGGRPDSPS